MDPPSSVNPSHSNLQRVNGSSFLPPKIPSTAQSVSILNNADNTHMNNTTFTTHNYNIHAYPSTASSLDQLYQFAAPNAILNAGGRADEVRCHPGTREEVVGLVEESISQEHTGPRMLWLSGPAGAGKTAIMQTVAERCEERQIPHANFFFFRTDSSRRDARPLVATLMHQIIKLYPLVGPAVAAALASDPLLFQMGSQKQFDVLMHQTLAGIQESPSALHPLVLLIDGLDECDSENKTEQRQLLQALDSLLIQKGQYFRVVVASRDEPQISMAFKQLRSQVDSLFLDEKYFPDRDIRVFITAEFKKIRSTHHLGYTLGSEWPSDMDIDDLVSKSSGQFIYAATAMRFIANSPASPIRSLKKVQGIVPPAKNMPFAHLDAIYTYVLDQVDELEAVKTMVAIKFLGYDSQLLIQTIMEAYLPGFSLELFDSCISELAPLVNGRNYSLEFFHASFSDFLKDKTRARGYYIDMEEFCAAALPFLWASKSIHRVQIFSICERVLEQIHQPTCEMTTALMTPHPGLTEVPTSLILSAPPDQIHILIENLYRIYAPHDLQSFIEIMNRWTSNNGHLKGYFALHLSQDSTVKA